VKTAFDVSVEDAELESGVIGVLLKLSCPVVEVNVWLTPEEARSLVSAPTLFDQGRTLRLGMSARAAVHWSRDNQRTIYLLVGEDATTWDVGATLDERTFSSVIQEIGKHLQGRGKDAA
jgi:hypothetical protein